MSHLQSIVDRCHVGESFRDVTRYVRSRLRRGAWGRLTRDERREILRTIADRHARNRADYASLMGGRRA